MPVPDVVAAARTGAEGDLTGVKIGIVKELQGEGYQSGVITANPGGLAYFRVKRDGRDEYTEGEAERIEHDAKADITAAKQ